ncbi:MAG: ABC transporter permease, partial [Mesorhizobium sp.]
MLADSLMRTRPAMLLIVGLIAQRIALGILLLFLVSILIFAG